MDIQQLKYFNVLAKIENMTKAAEMLGIGQSALSKNISKLEHELGYPLFDRKGKNIKLNHAGEVFLNYSKDAQILIDEGVRTGMESQNGEKKAIRISVVGECSKIVKCVKEYLQMYPETNFIIDEDQYGENIPDINLYDIVICPETSKFDVFVGTHFCSDELFLAVNKSHPLASRVGVKSSELEGLNLVEIKKEKFVESSSWDVKLLSIKLGKIYFVNTRQLHRMFITEGIACGIIPEGSIEYYNSNKIAILPITDKKYTISYKVAFKRDKHLSNEAKNFIEFFKAYFK